jgi:hypothetical protein
MIRSKNDSLKALPERLSIGIGGHFGPCYGITLERGRLIYTCWRPGPEPLLSGELPSEDIKPSAKQWQTFRRVLDRLNVWRWQEDLSEPTRSVRWPNWSVEIVYTDKAIASGGSKATQTATERPLVSRPREKTIPSRNSVVDSAPNRTRISLDLLVHVSTVEN